MKTVEGLRSTPRYPSANFLHFGQTRCREYQSPRSLGCCTRSISRLFNGLSHVPRFALSSLIFVSFLAIFEEALLCVSEVLQSLAPGFPLSAFGHSWQLSVHYRLHEVIEFVKLSSPFGFPCRGIWNEVGEEGSGIFYDGRKILEVDISLVGSFVLFLVLLVHLGTWRTYFTVLPRSRSPQLCCFPLLPPIYISQLH